MAELILSPIADKIIGSLCSAAVREIATIWGVNDELDELQNTISLIKAVLRDAEKKQVVSDGVRIWLRSLVDVVHEADDLMDEFDTEALRRRVMNGNEVAKQVCTFFSASNQLAFRRKLGRKIKEIRNKLALASNDKSFLLLEVLSPDEKSKVVPKRETHSFVPQEEVIGRDEEREAIVNLLLECRFEENLSVIPVVGMGGLGKTTLVQSVFNDERVQRHFELKSWVCISENFDVKVIVQKITKSSKDVELDQLQRDLRTMLGGKRYLLVLDDVWEEDREKWLELRNLMISGAEGSRVVVTTRSVVVASVTSPDEPYRLGVLDEEKSWSLFKKMAFRQGQEEKNPNLVGIGKEIVKSCRGIPLAIRAIGSTLYCKHSESEWSSFANEISKISREGIVLPTLRLSYNNLASHLKQCFAYCRLFPKDYAFEIRVLIQLWMAQGFLKVSDASHDQCLEDVGYQYFADLFERSFFQEAVFDKNGVVKRCKMHDLIHDLSIEVAGREYAIGNWNSKEVISTNVRHLSIVPSLDSQSQISTSFLQSRKIRTLRSVRGFALTDEQKKILDATIPKFKKLRTLDLSHSVSTIVLEHVSKLKHVRYLNLSGLGIRFLPNSITDLMNLQTLKLTKCYFLEELPKDMKKLVNLRHLEIDYCNRLWHMPVGLGHLTNLITLTNYVLPESSRSTIKDSGELRELMALNNLRGDLSIPNLRHGEAEVEFGILNEKQYLQSLSLAWENTVANINECEISLERLQPHPNLQKLYLRGYNGVNLPSWLHLLTNLVSLSVSCCGHFKLLFPMNHFHSLKKLDVRYLPSLEYITEWNTNHDASSLQTLRLSDLPNLKGWWKDYVERDETLPSFPRLTTLDIHACPNLTCMPLYPHLEELTLTEASLKPLRRTTLESSSSKLKSLVIGDIEGLDCLPEWFNGLSSLQKLEIHKCYSMENLRPGISYLTSLTELGLWSMDLVLNNVDEMIWKELNGRLQTLRLGAFPDLETLPEGLRHLTSLQRLIIFDWKALVTIPEWIGNLTSLKSLTFEICPKLTSLPEGIRSLTSLETLNLFGSPMLSERCQAQKGIDWPKISHIRTISGIQQGSESSEEAPQKKWKLLKGCLS